MGCNVSLMWQLRNAFNHTKQPYWSLLFPPSLSFSLFISFPLSSHFLSLPIFWLGLFFLPVTHFSFCVILFLHCAPCYRWHTHTHIVYRIYDTDRNIVTVMHMFLPWLRPQVVCDWTTQIPNSQNRPHPPPQSKANVMENLTQNNPFA